MKDLRLGILAAAVVLFAATAAAQSLVPAGSINGAVSGKPAAVVTHDEPAVMQYAKAIRDKFFAKATIYGEKDLPATFTGTSLLVYATPSHPWFEAHRKELPFTFGDGVVAIDGREFRGHRLRVITAMRNPDDAAQRVVLAHAPERARRHGPGARVVTPLKRLKTAAARSSCGTSRSARRGRRPGSSSSDP